MLHRIRLKKVVPNQLLEDNYRGETLQQDEDSINQQHDVYTITSETNFGDQFETRGNKPTPTNLPNGGQPVTSSDEPSDADENGVDYNNTRQSE